MKSIELSTGLPALVFVLSSLCSLVYSKRRRKRVLEYSRKQYTGTCHCREVVFSVNAPRHLVVWVCNCSVCFMKKNAHFIVNEDCFVIEKGRESLTEYRFNTGVAKHLFCSKCGVQSYYRPRSNPNGVAVTLSCLSPQSQIESAEFKFFDGENWENYIDKADIRKFSNA